LGGPSDLCDAPERYLPLAEVERAVLPEQSGVVTRIDTRAVGLAIMGLGGGRRSASDRIDFAVGVSDVAGVGEAVDRERPLARVFARDRGAAEAAANELRAAIVVGAGGAAVQTSASPISARVVAG
ncbi:MAG: thymidine phosphorylase, partial [Deltaproteobacteria bacterium]|nr:thymidine phosphorylase [Nannocystaceae bacterium]